MIIKPRPIPLNVLFNSALIARLDTDHPKIPQLETDIRKFMAGYRGEMTTDFHLKFIDDKHHHLFGGLRLPHEHHHFQIDSPVLSYKYLLAIETKHMSGNLHFSLDQFSQTSTNGQKGYNNPISQAQKHKDQLQDWFKIHRLPPIPIIPLVVVSNQSAIIQTSHPAILRHVCKAENLKNKILDLTSSHTKDILTVREFKKTSRLLLQEDTPHFPAIEKTHGLSQEDIMTGVLCPNCLTCQMRRRDRVWVCPRCFDSFKTAHRYALLDYFLLIRPTITNKEFRNFLGIDSIKTATYMLSALNLPATGEKKGRVYHRPADFLEQLETRYHSLQNA
ncbi:NERD domain-containing protein [Bacillus sp. FJAT-27251]|uniref:NERD domain-containing protein n=1 Tax=Bacillus sp. FJAT-27251 TaxID=1684142 RepID=UPI0006A7B47A|nr:NERD domain-containing protein [Bacillus sp. FJAT-27251]